MKLKLLIVLFFCKVLAFGQLEASNWYFGSNAGIHFDINGNVTALTDGKLATTEGCASISDFNGNLLFYSDGTTVYNKNHSIMQNGSGLLGHYSTSQGVTIVPLPGSDTIYYIFTLDFEVHPNGFRYSIIDISLDNGLGAITSKNILIYTPSGEKLSVTKNANNSDYWIVTHDWNNNNFLSYLLTSAGLNLTPIISSVGAIIGGSTDNVWGCMKISPDGSKLAISNALIQCELLDFNNSTGVVSNALTLFTYSYSNSYGIEFSPNSQVLYVSGSNPNRKIFQFDLTVSDILASKFEIPTNSTALGLQLGPNNKIYFTQDYTRWRRYVRILNVFHLHG